MSAAVWHFQAILLFSGVFFSALGSFVGINIGTDVSNLPSAVQIVALLRSHQITHVRLYDADPRMLNALSNTGIEVMVGITNEEVLTIGGSPSSAAAWINKNVAAYLPQTNITAIAVGNEVLTSLPNAAPALVSALNYIYKAIVSSNLNYLVKVSTPHSTDLIPQSFPPSTATFNTTWNATIYSILQFLKNTDSFYMLNAYPYYDYVKANGIFPIEYALSNSVPTFKQIVDPNTNFHYNSMFDSLVDAAYYSIAALNFSGIPIVVTETGWPWFGGSNEPDATSSNAKTYNNNLIRQLLNGSGTPSQPRISISAYIYELFNEDKRPGPVSERNWGVLFTNGTNVYDLSFTRADRLGANSSSMFCVARPGADVTSLQEGLNWACGQGQANCTAIQRGQPCFEPNTFQNHASYAYNDYYQRMRGSGGTCDFDGSATLTSVDPSYGPCTFTGSSGSSNSSQFPPPASGPTSVSSRNRVGFGALMTLFWWCAVACLLIIII